MSYEMDVARKTLNALRGGLAGLLGPERAPERPHPPTYEEDQVRDRI